VGGLGRVPQAGNAAGYCTASGYEASPAAARGTRAAAGVAKWAVAGR